jgi:primosomal protein N' (replication factor Y)
MPVARVVPEVALDRAFDYEIPPELRGAVVLGSRVRVPFGHRRIVGYVTDLPAIAAAGGRALKPVIEVIGDRPFLPPRLIELANWIAAYYCAPLAVAFRTILPEAVRRADAAFKQRLWVSPVVPALSPEVAALLAKKAPAQRAAWDFLQLHGPGWLADLVGGSGRTVGVWRGLAERNLVRIEPRTQDRDPFAETPALDSAPLALNPEQRAALDLITKESGLPKPKVILLHGVTGSGKTEIYLQAIARVIERGKSAIVLVPEIALTPQTVERFRARFAGMKAGVAVLHSHLSAGERHDQWQHIRSGRVRIVIGARSAVFAPLEDVGIIVVDEEHEHSYKQEESPHYQGRDVAVMRGHLEGAVVVLGSATPSLESFHHVQEGKYLLAALNRRVEEGRMPTIHILDLRGKEGVAPLIAPRLVEAIRLRLERREQSIIFLNRRGYSTSLQCPQCGHIEMCPNCSVALTFHRRADRLRCHLCNHAARVPTGCPQCGFAPFKYAGTGTEKVEQAIAEAFPGARLARMDADSMRGRGAYESTLGAFAAGQLDILVGTQMIAKGLHFPRVTCVGVINADLALQIPDFRASERVFQLLMQVSGRSGRGETAGEVFVQTRVPFHPAIQFARHHDYAGFAEQELEFRRALHYPPYERFILITARGRSEEKTEFVLGQFAQEIEKLTLPGTELTGPAPAPIARVEERYRFQLFLRTKRVTAATARLRPLFMDRAWPDDVRLTLDVDPVDLL